MQVYFSWFTGVPQAPSSSHQFQFRTYCLGGVTNDPLLVLHQYLIPSTTTNDFNATCRKNIYPVSTLSSVGINLCWAFKEMVVLWQMQVFNMKDPQHHFPQ